MIHYVKKEENKINCINDAIRQSSPGDMVLIGPGRYYEKVHITVDNITLIGAGEGQTTIYYDDYALKPHADGDKFGTFRTATLTVEADNVEMKHISIENSVGSGDVYGQAIALYLDGHKISLISCKILGHQDSLFIAPLPKTPRIPGSFTGPSEGKAYRVQDSFFYDTTIEGDIDFIFGSGRAIFQECTIISKNRNKDINGFVCAPSTRQGERYGFVFIDCCFRAVPGTKKASVYLGRPWRPYGKIFVFRSCIDKHIHPEVMDDWGNVDNRKTAKLTLHSCVLKGFKAGVDPNFVQVLDYRHHTYADEGLSSWHRTKVLERGGDYLV